MKIEFSEEAFFDLEEIEALITKIFSKEIAYRSIQLILDRIESLGSAPRSGKKDQTVKGLDVEVRYLIQSNSRIQYAIEAETIIVPRIRDTRQHPTRF